MRKLEILSQTPSTNQIPHLQQASNKWPTYIHYGLSVMSQGKTPRGVGLYRGLKGLSKASFTRKDPSDPEVFLCETSLTVHSVHTQQFFSLQGFPDFLIIDAVLHHVCASRVGMTINVHFDGLSLLDESRPNAIKPQKL